MKITNKQIKQLIKEELSKVIQEMQVGLGLSHDFSNEELYQHILGFLSQNPELTFGTPEYEKAEGLLSIVSNRVIQVVQNYGSSTSEDETRYMREIQGKLKMAKQALMQAMNIPSPSPQAQSWRQSRRDRYREMSKEYDDLGVSKYSSDRPHVIRKKSKF
tara:strand:- start:294 stop:773 length:480 start_codon:yes stop_codon:yes gene_type:complete